MITTKDMIYCFRCGNTLHEDGVCGFCFQEYQTSGKDFDYPIGYNVGIINRNCKLADVGNQPCQFQTHSVRLKEGECPINCEHFTCFNWDKDGKCPPVCWAPQACLPVKLVE